MTELSQDQVLAQLRTRGFEEGFVRTTLRDFWGVLTSVTGDMREGDRGAYLVALYNHENVEVIESTEPYTSPIGQFEVSASSRAKSSMGYLGASIDRIINQGIAPEIMQEQVKNQEYLVGKRCHWKFTPGHPIPKRASDGTWDDVLTNCWELIEIAGEATPTPAAAPATQVVTPAAAPTPAPPKPGEPPVSATQEALKELNGKNIQQWHQAVFVNPVVKGNTAFVQTIISGAFLAGQIAAGIVTLDEATGIYTVDMTKLPA